MTVCHCLATVYLGAPSRSTGEKQKDWLVCSRWVLTNYCINGVINPLNGLIDGQLGVITPISGVIDFHPTYNCFWAHLVGLLIRRSVFVYLLTGQCLVT